MKTHQELLIEARRTEALGSAYADDYQRAIAANDSLAARVVMTFSGDRTRLEAFRESQERAASHHIHRWIEAAVVDGILEYRLLQTEDREDGVSVEPEFVLGSDSAFDVLAEAYELEESERLGEVLAPFMERMEADGVADSIEPSAVEEVEQIVRAGELPPWRANAHEGGYRRLPRRPTRAE
ncbi:hypothetical protein [Opitutus terrae]|uniref:Uncharacterized protein n=1 Tax=Opitutus terrae (strain DSM 11246 / JCM 15787 / PB90-1) TaxID=452637 RepID=B1ZQ38_OPITP|nr:hypothetical protein [Opitutus terrae]ACB77757.1 hypothetical protein Oter_4486 [Opitutus terrae PB90-1]